MKKKLSFIGLLLFALILGACGNEEPSTTPEFKDVYTNVEDTVKEIIAEEHNISGDEGLMGYLLEDLTAEDTEGSMAHLFLERMDIKQEQLANGKTIGAMMNVNADEIFVLEANSAEEVEALKEGLERELAAQTQTWEQYLPDQYEKVKNNVIETNGNFLLYVTFSNPDKIVDAFKASFK